eukprot:528635_1
MVHVTTRYLVYRSYPIIGHVIGIVIGLCVNNRPPQKLFEAVKRRWKLCAINLFLAEVTVVIGFALKQMMPFWTSAWMHPENDSVYQFLLSILILDVAAYCFHKALHTTLRRGYHRIHHTVTDLDLYSFDQFYMHPIDACLSLFIPSMLSCWLSNNSRELTFYFGIGEIMFNALAHVPELHFDHVWHHHPWPSKYVSFSLGLFIDPIMGSSGYTLDIQITHVVSLPLIYYVLKLQSTPLLYLIVLTLCVTYNYVSRHTHVISGIKTLNIEQKLWTFWYN